MGLFHDAIATTCQQWGHSPLLPQVLSATVAVGGPLTSWKQMSLVFTMGATGTARLLPVTECTTSPLAAAMEALMVMQ